MSHGKLILVAEVNCLEPDREEEFNRWYNEVHIPEIMKVPGWTRATRYINTEPSEKLPKYLTIWELEDDAWKSFKETRKKQIAGEVPDFTWGPKFQIVMMKPFRRLDSQ